MNARKLGYRRALRSRGGRAETSPRRAWPESSLGASESPPGASELWGRSCRTPLDPVTAFAFFSHKFLRWILPFLLIAMLASSGLMWSRPIYRIAFLGQLAFYLWATLGFLFRQRMQGVRLRSPRLLLARDSPGVPGGFRALPQRQQRDRVAARELMIREPMKILTVVGTRSALAQDRPADRRDRPSTRTSVDPRPYRTAL